MGRMTQVKALGDAAEVYDAGERRHGEKGGLTGRGREDSHDMTGLSGISLKVYTPAEVARILRTGKNRVYELIHSGRLRAISMGKRYLIPEKALVALLGE